MAAPTRTPRVSWIEGTRLTPADDAARTRPQVLALALEHPLA